MARFYLPRKTALARALRGFGAPRKQLPGQLVINRSHPLAYKVEGFALPSQAISNGLTRVNSGYQGIIRNTSLGGGVGPSTPELKPVSHLVNCATVVFWTGTPRSYTWGSVLYAERPTSQQIYKLRFQNGSTTVITQTWRGAVGALLDGGATASIDTDVTLHAAAYVTTADSHWVYADSNSGESILDPAGTFNKADGQLLADPQDSGAYNNDIEIEIALTFNQPISREEFDFLRRDPWGIFESANQSLFSIGTAAAGVDYQETISSSVTSSANLVETYQAPAYSEVLASSVTSSATFAETYGAPAYSEVLASSVSSSANLVETYGAPNYSEVLASAVTSSASLVEAYEFGQAYSETITASVTSSATFAEAYQAPAYNETIAVSVTSSANLVEIWEVAYTEVLASAVTSSATLAETYESGLSYAETISASVTSSANLVETYGAPSYSEVLASAVTPSATFTETFTTPQALPTIVELSAITLPGYSAKSLRID